MSTGNTYLNYCDNKIMNSPTHKSFIERLDKAIAEKEQADNIKITRAVMGKHAGGIKASSVTEWRTRETWPKMANAVLLACWLGVCVEWLLSGSGPKHPEDRSNNFNASLEQQGLNQYWSMMTKEDQRSLLSLAARFVGSSKDSEGPVPPEDTGTSEKENA